MVWARVVLMDWICSGLGLVGYKWASHINWFGLSWMLKWIVWSDLDWASTVWFQMGRAHEFGMVTRPGKTKGTLSL